MRTFALILFSQLSGHCVFAQSSPQDEYIKKGTNLLGAFFNFSQSSDNTNISGTNLSLKTISNTTGGNLTYGKMTSHRWGLLLNMGYSGSFASVPTSSAGQIYNLETTRNELVISPSLRHYTFASQGNYFFISFSCQYRNGVLDTQQLDKNNNINNVNYNTNGFGAAISPGFTSFFSKKIAAEISIGALGFLNVSGKDAKGSTVQINTNQFLFYQNSVNLGLFCYF